MPDQALFEGDGPPLGHTPFHSMGRARAKEGTQHGCSYKVDPGETWRNFGGTMCRSVWLVFQVNSKKVIYYSNVIPNDVPNIVQDIIHTKQLACYLS